MFNFLATTDANTVPVIKVFLFLGLVCFAFILFIVGIGFYIFKSQPSKEWFLACKPASWPIVVKAKCNFMDTKKRRWVPVDVIFEEETITIKDTNNTSVVFPRAETYAGELPPPYKFRPAAGLVSSQQRIDLLHPTSWPIERHKGLKGTGEYQLHTKVLARRLELAKRGSVPDDSIPILWRGTTFLGEQRDYHSKHQ